MTLIELGRVEVGYHGVPVLPPVDLSIGAGDSVGIVGPNGSGKTTLVRTVLGLLKPVRGMIGFPSRRRPRFGYVPQRASVDTGFPLTAFEVTLMGRYGLIGPARRPRSADIDKAKAALRDVDAADLGPRPFHALSGGQRQRVLVARALASEPEILVLDEPTTGMDILSERAMLDLLRSFTARGIAVVLISHQLGAVADHVGTLVMVAGPAHPIAVGPRSELLTSERLSAIYGRPIVVRLIDGHSVIFIGGRGVTDLGVGFWESWELWREIVAVAIIAAGLCSFVGVYIVLRRVVFVSAAMSQMSGVGVAMAFFLCSVMQVDPHQAPLWLHPLWYATGFAALGAALFSLNQGHRRLASETVVGLGYLIAAGCVILILNSPRVGQEAHEVNDLLYGNAVVATRSQLEIMAVGAAAIGIVHALFRKEFLFTVFDAEMAQTLGLRTRGWSLLLFLTFAVSISMSTRAIGALPVFAFMVIPPTVGLLLADRMWSVFAVSFAVGVLSAFIGYWASFRWSLPTGASMVVASAVFLVPGLIRLRIKGEG